MNPPCRNARPSRAARGELLQGLAGFLLLAALAACSPSRTYHIEGRVVGFGDDGRTIIIEHGDIPRLMPAMTMPFKAVDASSIGGLKQGDAVAFTLHVSRDSSWIDDVRQIRDDAVPLHPAGAPGIIAEGSAAIVLPGESVPPFELVDQDGNPVRLADFQGRALLVTFIYTRCPLPEYCPLMSQRFQALQPALKERFGDDVRLLSISFDPEYDTPEVMREYAKRYTDDTAHWTFATGTSEQIAGAAEPLGVFYRGSGTEIVHNLTTALIGPGGVLRDVWRGNDWSTDEVMQAVEQVL